MGSRSFNTYDRIHFPSTASQNQKRSTIAVGIGNEYRRDDGVGLYLVCRLSGYNLQKLILVEADDNAIELLNLWNDTDEIILIEAAFSGNKAGTIYNFNAIEKTIPHKISPCLSTHSFGLADTILWNWNFNHA